MFGNGFIAFLRKKGSLSKCRVYASVLKALQRFYHRGQNSEAKSFFVCFSLCTKKQNKFYCNIFLFSLFTCFF